MITILLMTRASRGDVTQSVMPTLHAAGSAPRLTRLRLPLPMTLLPLGLVCMADEE